jgi:hypothetical protein
MAAWPPGKEISQQSLGIALAPRHCRKTTEAGAVKQRKLHQLSRTRPQASASFLLYKRKQRGVSLSRGGPGIIGNYFLRPHKNATIRLFSEKLNNFNFFLNLIKLIKNY